MTHYSRVSDTTPHLDSDTIAAAFPLFKDALGEFDPKAMVTEVDIYAQIERIAAIPVEEKVKALIDWEDDHDPPPESESFEEALERIDALDEIEMAAWTYFLEREYKEATGKSISLWEDIEPSEMDGILAFLRHPKASILKHSAVLKAIPNITEMAQQLNASRRVAAAKRIIRARPKPYCLAGGVGLYVPQEGFQLARHPAASRIKGSLQAWIYLEPHDEWSGYAWNEWDDLQLFSLSAVFLDVEDNGRFAPVAAMRGYYLVPFKTPYRMSEDEFHLAMHTNAVDLPEVWKVVVGRVIPDLGFSDLDTFLTKSNPDAGRLPGIVSMTIEVALPYQGCRISELLLRAFNYIAADADETDVMAPLMDPESLVEEEPHFNLPPFSDAPPFIFVLPIEGTRPSAAERAENTSQQRASPTPRQRPVVVDAAKEKRRLGLMRYFESIATAKGSFCVYTYNPHDYAEG